MEHGATTRETESGNFTASKKVNVDSCLQEFNSNKIVSWKHPVDDKTSSRHDMILSRDLLTALGLDLKFSEKSSSVVEVYMNGFWNILLTSVTMSLNP